jgi:hypothetical protein
MKYHERLDAGTNNAVRERPIEVARRSGAFRDADDRSLRDLPLSQLFLDHTLALSMLQDRESRWDEGHFAMIYPSINKSCRHAALEYQGHLIGEEAGFSCLTLEDAVDALLTLTDAAWVRQLKHRYLQQWPLNFTRTISGD